MITRNQAAPRSTIRFTAFFTGVVAPTFTFQNRVLTSTLYMKYLDIVNGTWSASPVSNLMQADISGSAVFVSAPFNHALYAETATDSYALVFSSNGTPNAMECEVWTFGSALETKLAEVHTYLLAPRLELTRPTSASVQRSFFDAKIGGNEVLRFTSAQNTSGTGAEETQTNNTDQIPTGTNPLPPFGLVATPGDNRVSLTWTPGGGDLSFNVYRTSAGTTTRLGSSLFPMFVDDTAINGITYTYTVTGVADLHESAASTSVAVTPTAPTP